MARVVASIVWAVISSVVRADEGAAFFEAQVLPILKSRCYDCHSHQGRIDGGLALDSKEGWADGGSIVPGSIAKSRFSQLLRAGDPAKQMPPRHRLPDLEMAMLETWIAMGAPDPRVSAAADKKKPVIDIEAGRKFWSYQPVREQRPPEVKDAAWPLNDVDRFILAKQEAAGLHPAPDAGAYALLRRVSLDLTGLPPTPEMIGQFAAGKSDLPDSPDSYGRMVDALLNSPAFGERWARHWLDLTGYADQIGTSNNVFAEHAWRYRDYVINTFNSDKPFDQFIREQIAGDLLAKRESDPARQAEMITATGFLVLGDVEIVAVDKLKMEHDLIDNQVSKIGAAFLGQTLGCVRCHDHKFDPIAMTDYYAMAGMFRCTSSTYKTDNGVWSSVNKTDLPETAAQKAARLRRLAENDASIRQWESERGDAIKTKADVDKQIGGVTSEGKPKLEKQRDELDRKIKTLSGQIEHAKFFAPVAAKAFAVHDVGKPADMRVTIRGNPYALGDEVRRGFPRVAMWDAPEIIPADESGRAQFANWIAHRRNPLTARVTVNRIWQKLFGEGLVRSVDYFGTRGDPPTHPELLDYLAAEFVRNHWSVKHLIRELVLSRTYRQSSATSYPSEKSGDNRLLTRMNRQRLDAEAIRDSMLAIAGRLATGGAGPALPLEYPENVTSLSPKAVNPPAFAFKKMRPIQDFQRTIYLPVIRSAGQPGSAKLRDVFDFTQPALISGRRPETAVPTQALFLLNSDFIRARAGELAAAIAPSLPDDAARLDALWLRALGRPVSPAERDDALGFLASFPADTTHEAKVRAWTELAHALLSSNEFLLRQ